MCSSSFTHCFRGRPQVMKRQDDRVLIGVLVARERELHFGCTPFTRLLLIFTHQAGINEWITGTRIQATVDEQLRLHVFAQVKACAIRRHTRDRSRTIESHGLDHLVCKQNAVVFIKVTQASIRMETTTRRKHLVWWANDIRQIG